MKKIYSQISAYLDYCEKVRKMSEITITTKRYTLLRFARETGVKELKKITNTIFNSYIKEKSQQGLGASSINNYGAVIIAFLRYYQGIGVKIPFKFALAQKIKEEKTHRIFYMPWEIENAISLADLQTGLMIRIMAETGMRIAELTNLKIGNFSNKKIQFIGKGNKSREVYIKDETAQLLREYINKFDIQNYLWGTTLNGTSPTTNTIRKRMKQAFIAAGIKGFYPHALRHSFATNLQCKGAEIAEIKEMMGHSSVTTTERYLHGFEGKLEELFAKYA